MQRLSDPTCHELVKARRLGALAASDTPLTMLAGVMPGLLPRQDLGEHVRRAAAAR
jgi:hypothetical protein